MLTLQSILKKSQFLLLRLRTSSLSELRYRAKQGLEVISLKHSSKKIQWHNRVSREVSVADFHSLFLPSFILDNNLLEKRISFVCDSLKIPPSVFEETDQQSVLYGIDSLPAEIDIRLIWEPARLQNISLQIITALQLQGTADAISDVKDAVLDWFSHNPFLYGIHYHSAMECGLRIPVFFYCLKSLGDLSDLEQKTIVEAMYLHAELVSKHLSLYSSLGNHTICECVGLIFAGAVFKNSDHGKAWLQEACSLLENEISHQILEDGGPAEQSLNYHRFVLDLYWLAADFLETNHLYDCSEWKPRLIQGEQFLHAFQLEDGSLPAIGDSDDGYAIAPGVHPKKAPYAQQVQNFTAFEESGYTIIRPDKDIRLTFDHGPLGMPPLYNHGHADALSITLAQKGLILLADSGTFRYNNVQEWRRYFKGTRAHNTVTIDGMDQAIQETGFIWSHPYTTRLLRSERIEGGYCVAASHNGYSRLKQPVEHTRSVLCFDDGIVLINDTFQGKGIHDFELNYHFHPEATVEKHDNWWQVQRADVSLWLKLISSQSFSLAHGQRSPILGWFSPAYGVKVETSVLHSKVRGETQEVYFITALCSDPSAEDIVLMERARTYDTFS